MNKSIMLGMLRHVLTAGGGMLAAKGVTDADTINQAIGIISAIAGFAWSY